MVKDPEQKANIYACLWTMINEQDVDKFKENESTFIDYWSSRQKKFIEYYQSEYKTKAGKLTYMHNIMIKSSQTRLFRKMGHVLPPL